MYIERSFFHFLSCIRLVSVTTMSFQVTEVCQLAKIAFCCGFCQAQLRDKLLGSDFFFVDHENYNIGQFSCQSWFYRPFIDHFLLNNLFIDHFFVCRYKELVDILLQMFAMKFCHTVDEDVCVLSFSGVNECLYVFSFVFFRHLCWQHTIFHLQKVHKQTACSAVTVSPWMDGYKMVVRPETQFVYRQFVCRVYFFASFVK